MNDIFRNVKRIDPNGPTPEQLKAGLFGGLGVIGAILAMVVLYMSYVVVEPGTVGVVTHFGAVQDDILPEGLHFVMPVKTKVIPIDIRVQKIESEATAASKDLQIVSSRVVLNYFVEKTQANTIFQELGLRYEGNIVVPAIQESVKSGTAQFNAEHLITRRSEVKNAISEDIQKRLSKYNVVVMDFSIIDFSFSPDFNKAIEDKQVAEQRALRATNDLVRIKTEAEQERAKAEGVAQARLVNAQAEAESQRLLRQTLNKDLVQLRAIEKWDGKLPHIMGQSTVPFLDVGK